MGKVINLICAECGLDFQKALNEYSRQTRRGKDNFFCKQSCATIFNNRKRVEEAKANGKDPWEQIKKNIKPWSGNIKGQSSRDEFSSFRWFVLRSQYRSKRSDRKICNLTVEYLRNLFECQNGICPITGWKLVLPDTVNGWENGMDPQNASIDRVDNSKGYLEGNVRFVSVMANLARNKFTNEQVIEFCKAVVNFTKL